MAWIILAVHQHTNIALAKGLQELMTEDTHFSWLLIERL